MNGLAFLLSMYMKSVYNLDGNKNTQNMYTNQGYALIIRIDIVIISIKKEQNLMKKYMVIREETNQRIGSYLGKLIDSRYKKRSDFYREQLRHEGINPDAEEVRKMGKSFFSNIYWRKEGITDSCSLNCY